MYSWIKWGLTSVLCITLLFACKYTDKPHSDPTWELIWSDEFNENGLPDLQKWSYDEGNGCPNLCGWGNNERQYYTTNRLENARISDGHLIIEARKETFQESDYTSARIVSKNKGDWQYGRFEARIKFPTGKGTWSAFWMLSTDNAYGNWPNSGEIDIVEHVGYEPDKVHGTIHVQAYNGMHGTEKGQEKKVSDADKAFHTYAVEWSADRIDWYVDDKRYHTYKKQGSDFKTWPYDKPFHLIFNIAVGGNWGGSQGIDEDIWPQQMVVDYVRVYQEK